MSDPFVAEIRIFGFNFAPTGWAQCNGQLLPLSQNTALFSLLGTFYGGDGKSTFALPNLEGSAPIQQGQGPGLSLYDIGQSGGTDIVTLTTTEIPLHAHAPFGSAAGAQLSPQNNSWGAADSRVYADPGTAALMNPQALALAGGSLPHNNMQPFLVLNFCIALQGIFPPRS